MSPGLYASLDDPQGPRHGARREIARLPGLPGKRLVGYDVKNRVGLLWVLLRQFLGKNFLSLYSRRPSSSICCFLAGPSSLQHWRSSGPLESSPIFLSFGGTSSPIYFSDAWYYQ